MTTRPIIVFDSGIGGLSIYRPLKKALKSHNILYLADTQYFPYGDKSVAWIKNRFKQLAGTFAELDPLAVVLACNSATTNVIEDLRLALSCKVIGVEPVIKPLSIYKHSLALMTQASAESAVTKNLLIKYGSHVQVFTPHGLASAIEYNDYEQVKKNLHEIKEIVQKNHIQAIGLSCTHYPLVIDLFKQIISGVVFIDPSEAVVKEVQRVLKSKVA